MESCGLTVDQVVFSGLASSYSVLTEDEKDLGVCMIDFGGGTMDIMVYTNGALRFSKVIPYAGNSVTDFVAQSLTTSRNEAESIKMHYGSAINPAELAEQFSKKKVEVAGLGGSSARTFTKAQIVSVTSRCYSDLLTVVEHELVNLRHRLAMERIKQNLITSFCHIGSGHRHGQRPHHAKSERARTLPAPQLAFPRQLHGRIQHLRCRTRRQPPHRERLQLRPAGRRRL